MKICEISWQATPTYACREKTCITVQLKHSFYGRTAIILKPLPSEGRDNSLAHFDLWYPKGSLAVSESFITYGFLRQGGGITRDRRATADRETYPVLSVLSTTISSVSISSFSCSSTLYFEAQVESEVVNVKLSALLKKFRRITHHQTIIYLR